MASGIQITVVGNITADPELKFSAGGAPMLSFSVAAERSYKKDDEWVNEVSYPDVIAWRQVAEDTAAVAEKGMRVIVTGRFEQRFWEDAETGQRRNKWQLVADEIAISTKVLESVTRKRRPEGDNAGGNNRPSNGGRSSSNARSSAPNRPASRTAPAAAGDNDGW